ncbi:hypothetical protein JG688_00013015 [Phytophthora aleatoria]|uniref:Uncharacterized protein n=1 Tax=Phytophthora aleatoria TaxID=2496075 RepID=A0A8J5IN21_9STRA|nr:hypothetical protein JG688_00013015 [Phytophthora aleatoria]
MYGLEVAERNPETSKVILVACRFSVKYGREINTNGKRKRTTRVYYFNFPFRTDSYTNQCIRRSGAGTKV